MQHSAVQYSTVVLQYSSKQEHYQQKIVTTQHKATHLVIDTPTVRAGYRIRSRKCCVVSCCVVVLSCSWRQGRAQCGVAPRPVDTTMSWGPPQHATVQDNTLPWGSPRQKPTASSSSSSRTGNQIIVVAIVIVVVVADHRVRIISAGTRILPLVSIVVNWLTSRCMHGYIL